MTMLDSLAISIPTLLAIIGAIIAWQNYKLNKKKADKQETTEEVNKKQEEETHRKEVELKLIAIEKDVQYIRIAVDKFEERSDDHERRIIKLESACKSFKGGNK